MNEEILIRMGIDQRPVAQALRGVSGFVSDWGKSLQSTMKGLAMTALAPVMTFFSAGKIRDAILDAAAYGSEIKHAAEAMGTSAGFVQGLNSSMKRFGVSSEEAAGAMGKLQVLVGQVRAGSDEAAKKFAKWGVAVGKGGTEEVFYRVATRLKEMQDPAERAAAASDLLGESARRMAPALDMGGDALERIIDGSNKLSDATVEKLDVLNRKIEGLGKKWRVFWGEIATGNMSLEAPAGVSEEAISARVAKMRSEGKVGPAAGTSVWARKDRDTYEKLAREAAILELVREQEKSSNAQAATRSKREKIDANITKSQELQSQAALEQMTTEQRIHTLTLQRAELVAAIHDETKDALTRSKAMVDLERVQADLRKNQAEAGKASADARARELAKVQELVKLTGERAAAAQGLARAKSDRMRFTLGELADLETRGATGDMQRQIWTARDILDAQDRAREMASYGNFSAADELMNRADEVRKGLTALTSSERNPFENLEKTLASANDGIEELVRKASAEGLRVDLAMAP